MNFNHYFKSVFIVTFLCFINNVLSARILAVLPVFIKSHTIFTQSIVRELAVRGHDVTLLTPFEEPDPPPTLRQVLADQKSCWDDPSDEEMEYEQETHPSLFVEHLYRWEDLLWFTETGLNSTNIKDFIHNDNSQYDLIIAEAFLQEAFLLLAHKYHTPVVMLSSFGVGHYINRQMGSPLVLAATPFEFYNHYGTMNLWQRVANTVYTLSDLVGRKYFYLPKQQILAERHFGHLSKPLPNVEDLERNVSLILTNNHFSIDTVRPNVPGIVEVGGVHIKKLKELPKDLKKFMDEAPEGFIFFSFGTIVKSSRLPAKKLSAILKVFSETKVRVLWKWENDENRPKTSNNVYLSKWLPQAEILAHPKIKAFITHGGLLGAQEAIYYGVPIVGVPFYGDQFLNVAKAAKLGYGVEVSYIDLSEITFKKALDKVLGDPSYRLKAKDVSKRFRDKPNTPMETAMFWIEYVIRHSGATHMRSPILDLRWYEYLLIDVAVVLIFIVSAVGITAYAFIMVICKLLFYRKPGKFKNNKNKYN